MKKIYIILFALLSVNTLFTSCSNEDPYSVASQDDDPRILDPLFTVRGDDGKLPIISSIDHNANLKIKLIVTPADFTQVVWYLDGEEVAQGTEIDKNLMAGKYYLKVVVTTTTGKSTFREGYVEVKPLSGEPWAITKKFERVVIQNSEAVLYGENLDKVKKIVIEGNEITDIKVDGDHITYNVPGNISDGSHRVIFVDGENNEYGADAIISSKGSVVTEGVDRVTSNHEWTMSGINMDKIKSICIGDQTITDIVSQSATEITVKCPALEDGTYNVTGKMQDGTDVLFYEDGYAKNEKSANVLSVVTLWAGHEYVSWNLAEGDPNRTFNRIGKDVFASIKPGTVLSVQYSINPSDDSHQMRITTGWWNILPGARDFTFDKDGVEKVTLTKEVLDLIQAEDGFLCVGHGYYIDMITIE